jgi:hypothetical protein
MADNKEVEALDGEKTDKCVPESEPPVVRSPAPDDYLALVLGMPRETPRDTHDLSFITDLAKLLNQSDDWIEKQKQRYRKRTALRASPRRGPRQLFFIWTALFGPATPPVPRFPPNLDLHPSGEPRPSPASRGVPGDSGREKSGDGPALSAREHANPTFSSQIPPPPPLSLLCRCRHHPSPIRRPVACTPPSLLPPAYIPPSIVPSAYIPPSGNSSRRASSTRPTGVCPFA